MSFDSPIIDAKNVIVQKKTREAQSVDLLTQMGDQFLALPNLAVQYKELAQSIISEYQKQGERIVQKALLQADAIRNDARQKGFQEGYQKGISQAADVSKRLEQILRNIEESRESYFHQLYPLVLQVIQVSVQTIVIFLPSKFREIIQERLEILMNKLAREVLVEIRLSPQDFDYLSTQLTKLKQKIPRLEKVGLKADNTLQPGDIRLLTEFGEAGMIIEEELKEVLEKIR